MATIGRTLVRVGGALLLAASALIYDQSALRHRARIPLPEDVSIVVARRDIREGEVIDGSSTTMLVWPAALPAGAFTNLDAVRMRVANGPIFEGEVILPRRLLPVGSAASSEIRITPGTRAMSIRVSENLLTRLIQPNSRVDVLDAFVEGGTKRADLIVPNLRVLAVGAVPGQHAEGQTPEALAVTLEVTPYEARMIAAALVRGPVELSLRGSSAPSAARLERVSRP